MPEEIFDSAFAARVIRYLQLKRGRGPSEVGDEIIPVLDLGPLLTNLPELGGSGALEASHIFSNVAAGNIYRVYLPPQAVAAGEVGMRQIFNPLASGRAVFISAIETNFVTAAAICGRRHNTQLATADFITTIPNRRSGRGVAVAIFRKDDQLPAAVPPAGAGQLTDFVSVPNAAGTNLLFGNPVFLAEGEGYLFYPCSNNPATDSDPAGTINQPTTWTVTLLEIPLG